MVRQVLADAIRTLGGIADGPVVAILQQGCRHRLDRQHMVDKAAGDRTLRHAALGVVIELGLAQGQAAMLLDRSDAERPVAAIAGEDDADRILALVLRQRDQEGVDRGAASGWPVPAG